MARIWSELFIRAFLPFALLYRRFMTRRRFLLSHIRRVAISTLAGLLELLEFRFNRHSFWISRFLAVAMTRSTGVDWHVRCQTARRPRACDIDVACRALSDVLAFAAFVRERGRDAFPAEFWHESVGRFMTARAIVGDGLLVFPVTVKARIVRARHRLEGMQHRRVKTCSG